MATPPNMARTADPGAALKAGKRAAIIRAATQVFLTSGYGASSMDSIARTAGVAKQTLYSHFGSKDALFEAIIQQKCDDLSSPLVLPGAAGEAPEEVLLGVARGFLTTVLEADVMALFRTLLSEVGRFPDLAQTFYRVGPGQAAENVAEYLRQLDLEGRLKAPDPVASARQFFALLRGDLYMRCLLGLEVEDKAVLTERTAREAVASFLAAHH